MIPTTIAIGAVLRRWRRWAQNAQASRTADRLRAIGPRPGELEPGPDRPVGEVVLTQTSLPAHARFRPLACLEPSAGLAGPTPSRASRPPLARQVPGAE